MGAVGIAEVLNETEAIELLGRGADLAVVEHHVVPSIDGRASDDGWDGYFCYLYVKTNSQTATKLADADWKRFDTVWAKRLEAEGATVFHMDGSYPNARERVYQLFEEIEEWWYDITTRRVEPPL